MANETANLLGLTEGAQVIDADGAELGKVAGFRQGYFKIEVPMGRDYWLQQDTVAHADVESVKLRLRKGEVENQKIDSGAEGMFEEQDDAADAKPALSGTERRYEDQAD